MSLVNSNDGIKKILLKAVNGKNSLSDTRKIPKIHWKNSDEISEKDDSQDNSRIEEPMPIQRINLFIQNKNLVDSNKNNANLMKAKGIEPVPKKTVMFLLDEFFILFLKYMICLSLLEKRLFNKKI